MKTQNVIFSSISILLFFPKFSVTEPILVLPSECVKLMTVDEVDITSSHNADTSLNMDSAEKVSVLSRIVTHEAASLMNKNNLEIKAKLEQINSVYASMKALCNKSSIKSSKKSPLKNETENRW